MEQCEIEEHLKAGAGTFGVVKESFAVGNLRRLITGCLISWSSIGTDTCSVADNGVVVFFQMAGTNAGMLPVLTVLWNPLIEMT